MKFRIIAYAVIIPALWSVLAMPASAEQPGKDTVKSTQKQKRQYRPMRAEAKSREADEIGQETRRGNRRLGEYSDQAGGIRREFRQSGKAVGQRGLLGRKGASGKARTKGWAYDSRPDRGQGFRGGRAKAAGPRSGWHDASKMAQARHGHELERGHRHGAFGRGSGRSGERMRESSRRHAGDGRGKMEQERSRPRQRMHRFDRGDRSEPEQHRGRGNGKEMGPQRGRDPRQSFEGQAGQFREFVERTEQQERKLADRIERLENAIRQLEQSVTKQEAPRRGTEGRGSRRGRPQDSQPQR